MEKKIYDLIIVGGGIGGSVLAKVMAEHGARVLVVERDKQFKDRVRGEGLHAWGVPEARALGIYELLRATCGLEVRWWDMYLGSQMLAHRDFTETTPHRSPLFSFYHPEMQEVLLTAAAEAGAEVWRGAAVRKVRSDPQPTVTVEQDGWMSELHARLVVAADGRSSPTRKWMGFEVHHDPARRLFTGVLLENVPLPLDTWYAVMNPTNGQEVFLGNIGQGRVRAYFGYPKDAHQRFLKPHDTPRLFKESIRTGAAAEFYMHARAVGPMASFASDDAWVEHPYRKGVALIGDAAATCDPSFGQGLAMALRSARLLRDELLKTEDWEVAGHAYAEAQHRDFAVIHSLEADARRERALPLIAQDATRVPDLFGMGPDAVANETIRRRFFGEA